MDNYFKIQLIHCGLIKLRNVVYNYLSGIVEVSLLMIRCPGEKGMECCLKPRKCIFRQHFSFSGALRINTKERVVGQNLIPIASFREFFFKDMGIAG